MNKKSPLGELELQVLRYIANRPPATVGEVAEGFGVPRNLARSTVQTMMERLHKKEYLVRIEEQKVFRYAAKDSEASVLRCLVQTFIEKTLSGRLSPFVAYLSETQEVSQEEFQELRNLVSKLEAQQKEQDG